MNEGRYKTLSFTRAGLPAALAFALLAAVFLPLLAMGADAPRGSAARESAARRDWSKELGHRDGANRRAAAAEAGRLRDASAGAALRAALGDSDAGVRREAAAAAGMVGDAGSVPGLLTALGDSNASVRFAAIRSLGQVRAPEAVAALGDVVSRGGSGERALALEALARGGDPGALAPVLRSASAEDPALAADALRALQWADGEAGLEVLESALGRPEEAVRSASAFSLARRGRLDAARGTALSLLASPLAVVRVEAAQAAELVGGSQAREALTRAREAETDPWVRSVLESSLGRLP